MMEQNINEENIENNLEQHFESTQYQDLFFEIRYIRTKYVYFRLNFNFGFFIKP